MKKQITEIQQMKLKKLNEELRELWESLTPSEKERRVVFNKFLDLQKQVQAVQVKNKKLNEKE
jgi:uncharacterized coiled-coil protein SlyX